jgi:MFS superfamily sulfate permease-like transporter
MKKNETVNFKNESLKNENKSSMLNSVKKGLLVLTAVVSISNFSYSAQGDTTTKGDRTIVKVSSDVVVMKIESIFSYAADSRTLNNLLEELKSQILKLRTRLLVDVVNAENEIATQFNKERNIRLASESMNAMSTNEAIENANEEINAQLNRMAIKEATKVNASDVEEANAEVENNLTIVALKSLLSGGLQEEVKEANNEIDQQISKAKLAELNVSLKSENETLINNANTEIQEALYKQQVSELKELLKKRNEQLKEEAEVEVMNKLSK